METENISTTQGERNDGWVPVLERLRKTNAAIQNSVLRMNETDELLERLGSLQS